MKLFVSDIDGTLYYDGDKSTENCPVKNKNAIDQWIKAGNQFALATARVHTTASQVLEDLGVAVDYLGGNGAEIVYKDQQKQICPFKLSVFFDLVAWLNLNGVDGTLKIYSEGRWICSSQKYYPYTYPSRMRKNLMLAKPMEAYQLREDEVGCNMSLILRSDLCDGIKSKLQRKLAGIGEVVSSDVDNLDFLPLGCSKKNAVLQLLERYQLDAKDLIVIGDSENDVSMFELTEHSYCMAQAELTVRQKAKHVVKTVSEAIALELKNKED